MPQGESPMDEGKMMTAAECARHILNAIKKKKRTLVLNRSREKKQFL